MKRKFYFFCLLFIGFGHEVTAQVPTVAASNIVFSQLDGDRFVFSWTNGNGALRIIIMRQGSAVTALPVNGVDYNSNSSFGNGDAVQPGQFVVFDGNSSAVAVSNLLPNTTYHIAIFEYNGTASSTQYLTASFASGSQATLTTPTTQASAISFSNIIGNSTTVNWVNGNGQRRLLVARAGSAVNANPVDLIPYSASATFGNGSQLGTGNYVVFGASASTTAISNLQPNTTYHYALYEYNGSQGPLYLIPGATGSMTTAARPSIASSALAFSSIDGDRMTLAWTSGNGTRRIIVARAGSPVTAVPADGVDYNANAAFGSGDAIQPGEFVVFDNTSSSVALTGLSPNTTYHFRIYEYDGTGSNTGYLTSTFLGSSQSSSVTPASQISNIIVSNITGNSATLTWTNGSGARRLVLARQAAAVNFVPVDLTFYNQNAAFGTGTQYGTGNYALFSSTGNTVNVTNLLPNTVYHFEIFEYNGSSAPVYLRPGAVINFTTSAQPTVASSGLSFTQVDGDRMIPFWTTGNGTRRIMVARAGSPVTAVPVDGIDYTASSVFGSGDAILPGEFVVYDNTGGAGGFTLTGLQAATTYHFRIYEYNGSGATTAYLTSSFATGSRATLSAPGTQASAINFTNVGGSNLTMSWTSGNGASRIALVKQGSAVDANPVNLTSYNGNTSFGAGAQIGSGNFAVLSSGSNTVAITNLVPNTTYHVAVFEYNGSNGPVYLVPGATANITTAPQPTIISTALAFTQVDGDRMIPFWTPGNGTRRIMVARASSPVTAVPVNGIDYNANTVFGSGDAIQPGQFVVFDNIGGSGGFNLSGLLPGITYHFAVFEYDGTGAATTYLTSSFLSGSQATVGTPTVQASNVSFSSVAGTSVTVNWTNGNGSSRLLVARLATPVNADPVNFVTYNGSTVFGTGVQIGTGNYVINNTASTSTAVTGLTSGSTYYFSVYEYNGNNGRVYLIPGASSSITTLGAPQTQATNVSPGSISTTTMQLNWTNGSGNRRLVLMKQGSAVDAAPVNNGTYNANSAFGAGTQLGSGNFAVFNATGNSVLVTGLTPNTTYHFSVFEYNDFGATSQFLLTSPATGNATTLSTLPVVLIDFTARNESNSIRLEWSTAQEFNSSHFEIQKNAHSNQVDFIAAGIVSAAGESNSRKNYSYIDDSPLEGTTYYRIRQVDRDGRSMFSKTVSVKYQPKGLIKKVLNPVRNDLFIQLTSFIPGANNEWRLYDMNGRMIHGERFSSQTIYAIMPAIASGVYVLEVRMNNKVERIKISKVN